MKPAPIAAVATAVALLGLGALAGTVIGGDGTAGVADRVDRSYGEPERQSARALDPVAQAAKKKKKPKKPVVFHGGGDINDLGPGESILISLQCPAKYPAPISAGLDSAGTGVVANVLTKDLGFPRSLLIGAVNTAEEPRQFRATGVCMKGVKEAR